MFTIGQLLNGYRTIPKCGDKRLAGWNEEVRPCPLKDKSILWNKIWREAGCPSVGILSQLRKRAKCWYKYAAVRRLIRNQDIMRRKCMAEAMVSDSSRDFWHEVNCRKIRKQTTLICVDGVLGDDRIVELYMGFQIQRSVHLN